MNKKFNEQLIRAKIENRLYSSQFRDEVFESLRNEYDSLRTIAQHLADEVLRLDAEVEYYRSVLKQHGLIP